MADFNVGDKVVVSAKIEQGSKYRFGFVDSMKSFYGKTVTIAKRNYGIGYPREISDDGYLYHIKEDNEVYNWASSMFSSLAKKEESKSTDNLKICVKTKRIMFNFKN